MHTLLNPMLKPKQRVTIFGISEGMAHTTQDRIEVITATEPTPVGWAKGKIRLGTGRFPGKRKAFYIDVDRRHGLLFDGWELPFCSQAEAQRPGQGTSFSGNACLNLCGKPDEIREWIATRNLNPEFSRFDSVLVLPPSGEPHPVGQDGAPLYPETDTSHAVVNRIRAKIAAAAEPVATEPITSEPDESVFPLSLDAVLPPDNALSAIFKPNERIAKGLKALEEIRPFLGHAQAHVVRDGIRGEEGDFFIDKMIQLRDQIAAMPHSRQQEGEGDNAIVHLHYFTGACDWWIIEKDEGSPDDRPEDFQSQAFGFACLGMPDCAELGYISIPEVIRCGGELDFHWTPKPIGPIKARLYGNPEPEPEPEVVAFNAAPPRDPMIHGQSHYPFKTPIELAHDLLATL